MRLGRIPVLRRLGLGWCLGLTLWLAACSGAGTKYDEFLPQRLVVLGDEISYVGCSVKDGVCQGTYESLDRFTVNYTIAPTLSTFAPYENNWVSTLARLYGLSIDKVVESTYVAPGMTRRQTRKGATVGLVKAQADHIPAYQSGDLLIIAGGANDVLCVLQNVASNAASGCSSTSLRPGLDPNRMIESANAASLGNDNKALRIIAAAHAYQNLALDMLARGHRNVFLVPVYDFSNSPNLNNFCNACSASDLQTATTLFNTALRAFTDSQGVPLTFSPGEPRILLTTGISASDSRYVNITQFTAVPGGSVYGFELSPSICGIPFDASACNWNGIYAETVGVSPIFKGAAYLDTVTGDARPLFLTNQGRYVYTADFYLSPSVQSTVGSMFYSFMRGFQGW